MNGIAAIGSFSPARCGDSRRERINSQRIVKSAARWLQRRRIKVRVRSGNSRRLGRSRRSSRWVPAAIGVGVRRSSSPTTERTSACKSRPKLRQFDGYLGQPDQVVGLECGNSRFIRRFENQTRNRSKSQVCTTRARCDRFDGVGCGVNVAAYRSAAAVSILTRRIQEPAFFCVARLGCDERARADYTITQTEALRV